MQAAAWKISEDYTEGLRLWKQRYGENVIYKMLCMGPNAFNRERMLNGLMDGVVEHVDQVQPPKPENPDIDQVKDDIEGLDSEVSDLHYKIEQLEEKIDELSGANLVPDPKPLGRADEPEEIKKMRKTTHGFMDERTALKQHLRDLPDPERRADRKVAALRILAITDELDILFAKLDYFKEYGRVPEQIVIEEDTIQYPKAYLNARTYVSKTLRKIAETSSPERKKKLEALLKKWQDKIKEFETEL